MRTALDLPADKLDEHEQEFVAQIREHGWHSTSVLEDDEGPGFTYTTGFWVNLGVPEVILFALDAEVAHDILWDVYREAKGGRQFPTGVRVSDIFANVDSFLVPMGKRHYAEYLGWSRWFYSGDEFPCAHLVWPDKKGRFPWEPGIEESFRRLQPDITASGWIKALSQ
jgi:hypothetical protein